jgi:hypothetical protein
VLADVRLHLENAVPDFLPGRWRGVGTRHGSAGALLSHRLWHLVTEVSGRG